MWHTFDMDWCKFGYFTSDSCMNVLYNGYGSCACGKWCKSTKDGLPYRHKDRSSKKRK